MMWYGAGDQRIEASAILETRLMVGELSGNKCYLVSCTLCFNHGDKILPMIGIDDINSETAPKFPHRFADATCLKPLSSLLAGHRRSWISTFATSPSKCHTL